MGNSLFDEVYVNGNNSDGQYFYLKGKKMKFSIYPIILENLNGEKEHVFSVVYIYSDELYFDELNNYNSSMAVKIILELLLIIIFGSGLLYIIFLTFNILAKYIVIPIKNVNYMLRGINIGGKSRLKYLDYLKKKHDDNLKKLEKMYLLEARKNSKEKELIQETETDLINNKKNNNLNSIEKVKPLYDEGISINSDFKGISINSDFNEKYDEESNYIEKEISFYDFNEQLLQYRPLEMEFLVNSLMDLKGALNLTSLDREVEEIIDYSHSEEIFRNFKNKEGAVICQSNIGNLQSQLLKFDKAIYHLALSLEDNKLKKFLNNNLSDELDENDSLLNDISNPFKKRKKKEKNNILLKKQMNNSKNNFSQKIIGILINTRYGKLIYAYYMFFKNLKKLQKSNYDIINGQFMNTSFHTINYYHKIIIQFIYLSFIKNDLIKIGESILDYLEFLIKFKFKTSTDDKFFLNIKNNDLPEYRTKQNYKKKIFNKIVSWFNLFDDYVSYIKDNSSLGDLKSIIEDYSKSNSENVELNYERQSSFMFKINIQKCDFLKGKFCLSCKNYKDALFYFIRAAKRKSIVIDGLIKKRSLKHIFKLLKKLQKNFVNYRLKNLNEEKELKSNKKVIYKKYSKKFIKFRTPINRSENTFGEELEIIKKGIIEDINECNEKQEKDVLILIDFNIYNKHEEGNNAKTYKIDSFIEQTIVILNQYLLANDRFGLIIYTNKYQIICPLMIVKKIDFNNITQDLFYYKSINFKGNNETEEYDINFDEFNLEGKSSSEYSQEDSNDSSDIEEKNNNKIKGLVDAINFLNVYLKMKEGVKNEKYIILFTDMFNILFDENEQIEKYINKIKEDMRTIFILVGKNKKLNKEKNKLEKIILLKYRDGSEVINFENMKKIKAILSNNNIIKDEIIYPNEIYK